MFVLVSVVFIIASFGDVLGLEAQVPDVPIPDYLPTGAAMYSEFTNVVDGQTKAWPNYGIAEGDVTQVEGIIKTALYFNGDKQYMDMGEHQGKCLGNLEHCPDGYSLTMIIKADDFSTGGPYYYFSSGGQSELSHGIAVFTRDNRLVVTASTRLKKWEIEAPEGAFPANEWTHLAVTWAKTEGVCLWINDDEPLCTNDYTSRNLDTSDVKGVFVGAPNNSPNENNGKFAIDNLVSYDLVLTKTQILRMAGKVP